MDQQRDEIDGDATHGALLMLSMPPATTTLLYPDSILWAASMMDFKPLAQTLLIVVASEEVFMPALSAT